MTEEKLPTQNQKKYLKIKDSIQDSRVNQILDKLLVGKKLNKEETKYLDKFDYILKLNLKDYSHLSKNVTVEIITSLIDKKIKVICELTDRNGKFNDEIIKLKNEFEDNKCEIYMKKGEICFLSDKFLYNLIYNIKKNYYSLTIQDEYFEKITIDKNED
jgi:hypothetical protein